MAPPSGSLYRLTADGELFEFRPKSGYCGSHIGKYRQPGSNGLTRDREGRLTISEHGNRRVTRIEKNRIVTTLADRFEGKRLNSPNDLVYRSDGALFFTDPPFGLPLFHDDPRRELNINGVYCLINGTLKLVSDEQSGPNGLAFSPDERFLYVVNWDEQSKAVTSFEIGLAGNVVSKSIFCDLTSVKGEEANDGIKVDLLGNVYVSGPGGLSIFSSQGLRIGTIRPPEHLHNMTFGGDDGRDLYLTCFTSIYRARLNVSGAAVPHSMQDRESATDLTR